MATRRRDPLKRPPIFSTTAIITLLLVIIFFVAFRADNGGEFRRVSQSAFFVNLPVCRVRLMFGPMALGVFGVGATER